MCDISDLTIKELISRVTERLKELESLKNSVLIDNFRLGDPIFLYLRMLLKYAVL